MEERIIELLLEQRESLKITKGFLDKQSKWYIDTFEEDMKRIGDIPCFPNISWSVDESLVFVSVYVDGHSLGEVESLMNEMRPVIQAVSKVNFDDLPIMYNSEQIINFVLSFEPVGVVEQKQALIECEAKIRVFENLLGLEAAA
jgi:hypothetical protein